MGGAHEEPSGRTKKGFEAHRRKSAFSETGAGKRVSINLEPTVVHNACTDKFSKARFQPEKNILKLCWLLQGDATSTHSCNILYLEHLKVEGQGVQILPSI